MTAGQQRVARAADGVTMKPSGTRSASGPSWRLASVDEVGELPGQVAERVADAALELLGRGRRTRSRPRCRACRRRAGAGRARLGSAAPGRRGRWCRRAAARQASDEPPAPQDRGLDREHVERDRRRRAAASASGCPADRPNRTAAAATSQRSGRDGSAVRGPAPSATSRQQDHGDERRWRACGSACVPIAQTIGVAPSPIPAASAEDGDRVSARTRSTVIAAATATRTPRAGSSGRRHRRTA